VVKVVVVPAPGTWTTPVEVNTPFKVSVDEVMVKPAVFMVPVAFELTVLPFVVKTPVSASGVFNVKV